MTIRPTRDPTDAHHRGFRFWLVPDLAMALSLATLIVMFFSMPNTGGLFNDSDTGWHIRTGELILSTGLLPRSDPFSFSKPGEPWVAWEWGTELLMGGIHLWAGLAGIALLYGLCIAACVWMWFRLSRAAGGNLLVVGLIAVPMLTATALHWLARPHVFSWLFLLGTVWLCEQMPHPLRPRHLLFVAIAAAAWANFHASFFMGPAIAFTYAAGAYIGPMVWEIPAMPVLKTLVRRPGNHAPRDYTIVALAASAGTLANPYGWALHRHIFAYLSNSGLMDHIQEFQSFDFHSKGAYQVTATFVICFAGAFAALAARRPERFLLSILLTLAGLHSVRAIPVAALLILPLASGSITDVLARAGNLTPALRRGIDNVLACGERLKRTERPFRGYAWIPLFAVLIFASVRNRAGFPPGEFPVAASAVVASLPVSARILAPDIFSSYLIYRFDGRRKVFFDGRSDFYGTALAEQYLRLFELRPGWRKEFNHWHFTYALLPPDYPMVDALEANSWRELYRDRTAVLLTGPSPLP
jgi:hypothetical protein